MDALPDDLLSRILALLPDNKEDYLDTAVGIKISSRRAAEHVCCRWHRLALALPASRVALDFQDSVFGEDEPGFVSALLQALGGRPVGRVEIVNAPSSLPSDFWAELGVSLISRARGAMPCLRTVDFYGVLLTAELAAALAGGPLIEAVDLSPENGLEHIPQGVWEPLALLGSRLKSLHLVVYMAASDRDPDGAHQLPPGLLVLTGLGRLDMLLIGHDAFPRSVLPGLERLPLHTLTTDGGTPVEVWSCMQLSELRALNNPIVMLPADHGTLPPLRSLELICWHSGGFPAILCGLSRLTALSLYGCQFPSGAALPRQVSQLSTLQHLSITNTHLNAASLEHLAQIPGLTQLTLSQCGINSLPAGPYLHNLVQLSIDGNAFQPRRQPIPPAVLGCAAQLTSLAISLDAREDELREQWAQVEAILLELSKLKSLDVSFLEAGVKLNPGRVALVSVNSNALACLRKLQEQAPGLGAIRVRDIGHRP
ncbi:leucine rich repeat [Chlorella sorokiniana]|uniref:Leucine rich repeat n=1 Tax=Chlorella sorokiniana TaxID=3076 RepID=A0A2P6TIG1_CHLSO|nr:leucine rich repeat [Chlorella sorokiniana]|eukprot:PRW34084.1 leucine rich repeat [Chlorella sorokiniana]